MHLKIVEQKVEKRGSASNLAKNVASTIQSLVPVGRLSTSGPTRAEKGPSEPEQPAHPQFPAAPQGPSGPN